MNLANTILEYLKTILTAPVLFSFVALVFLFQFREDLKALILRIAKIKLPGGTEVSTPQSSRLATEEKRPAPEPHADNQLLITGLPDGLTTDQRTAVEKLIRSHIATTYLWEYRYLNYFLAHSTQVILDWLISLPQTANYSLYDSVWLPIIPSAEERQAIITALQAHHLVHQEKTGLIAVTPKGREYQEWRGPLPPLTTESEGRP